MSSAASPGSLAVAAAEGCDGLCGGGGRGDHLLLVAASLLLELAADFVAEAVVSLAFIVRDHVLVVCCVAAGEN